MQLRLYSSDRDAELLRDLLVLIPFNVVQDERGPCSAGNLAIARSRSILSSGESPGANAPI